jgi:hypothetical protein
MWARRGGWVAKELPGVAASPEGEAKFRQ